jgi:hypothetical protein
MGVLKVIGRTTPSQEGVVNGVMADCHMACPLVKDSPTFATREWIVLQPVQSEPVSTAGDSGTFFVLESRHTLTPVVGMMFGGVQVTWPPILSERRTVMRGPLPVVGMFYSSTRANSPPTRQGDGGVVTQDEGHNETEPVVGGVVEDAAVAWPQSLHGGPAEVTEEHEAIEETYHLVQYEPSPFYGTDISIITPASTILSWLAQDLSLELEFGEFL